MGITQYDVGLKNRYLEYKQSLDKEKTDPSGSIGHSLADLVLKRAGQGNIEAWIKETEEYEKSQNSESGLSPEETFYRRAEQLHLNPKSFDNIQDKRKELEKVLNIDTSQMDDAGVKALFAQKYFAYQREFKS